MDKKGKLLYQQIQHDRHKVPRSYSMPESMIELLKHIAKRENTTASEIVRQAVKNFYFNKYIAVSNRQSQRE